MAQSVLKSILGKRSEIAAWLRLWADTSLIDVAVEDSRNTILFGAMPAGEIKSFPILLEGETEGYVHGTDHHASLVAGLLTVMVQKEAEKKKLGNEVLNVYQELNVIYNFSEKLTETIDPDMIARLALEQALHSIPSASGVIVLWDEGTRHLSIASLLGEAIFDEVNLVNSSSVLLRIGLSGQSEILSDLAALKSKGIVSENVQSLIYAGMKVKQRMVGAIILASDQPEHYTAAHLKLLVTLALQSATAIESATLYEKNIREVREREEAILRIHAITKKFVPNEFILSLGKEAITDVRLGDLVEKNVTVLFTDIRDFTSLSEKMTPEENFRFVSSFNERLGPIIRTHNGFINQYLGDSIMAIFPVNPADALNAAIEMQQAIHELNNERFLQGLPAIHAGIGMHTGPLIMGITGDEHRLDAATISDTVNTAARIEGLTKYYKSPLLLSSHTLNHIPEPHHYFFRRLGKVLLKGKNNQLDIVECLNGDIDKRKDSKTLTLHIFNEAVLLFQQQQFEAAIDLFRQILAIDPDDFTAIIFMEKATHYLYHGAPDNWSGAVEMQMK
jgi:class 3 adenylate cyclase